MKKTIGAMLAAALGPLAAAGQADAGRQEAIQKLGSMKITVDFKDMPLGEAVDYLREVSGLNMVVSARVTEKHPDLRVTLKVRDLTVKSCLKLMIQGRELTATWKDGAIVLLPSEDVQSNVEVRLYDVRAQLVKIQDFPGPRVELAAPAGTSARPIVGGDFQFDKEPPIPPETLVMLIKENTGDRTWDNGSAHIELANGRLVVSQTPAIHREIERLLRLLEQYK